MTIALDDEERLFIARLRLINQDTWTDIASSFANQFDKVIDWRTLKKNLFAENQIDLLAKIQDNNIKDALTEFFDNIGILELFMFLISELVVEWRYLRDMHLRILAEKYNLPEEERTLVPMDSEDKAHMKELWQEIVSCMFQVADKFKVMNPQQDEMSIVKMFKQTETVAIAGPMGLTAIAEAEGTQSYVEALIAESEAKLRSIHAEHRAEGRGAFRAIPESNDDEDDIFI